ncbi:MAG: CCA tRNA nucleotidyltransferase [Campylobacterales bacterium]|nr:CCA tRNA nucleotidyltransferase [Campylobacterales bacterium]
MPTITSFPHFFAKTPIQTVQQIQKITEYLKDHYHGKCYVVGGAVRDRLLGRECQDYDIECFGVSPQIFEKAMHELGAQGVGKSFFVYKLGGVDISLPRSEKKIGVGHRGFEVMLASDEKEASRRRDFTINALMYDIENKQILDFWNGLKHLDQKILAVVDEKTFSDDSLRVLRAMQFASRLGFKVEKKSCRLCQNISLHDLSKERVFLEFEKMFKSPFLHYGLYYFSALGIAEKLLNIKIDRKDFFTLSRELTRAEDVFVEELRPYYFLFIAKKYLRLSPEILVEKLGLPKIYLKKVGQPSLPSQEQIDNRLILHLALKEGIICYLGNYDPKVVSFAKKLGVWDTPFKPNVTANVLMAEGFSGKALGEELGKRIEKEIDSLVQKGV